MEVEIFVLTYNRKDSLRHTISSLLNQTFTEFKILVLDNASNYDVNESLATFNDSRIELIVNSENIGPVENYVKAINLASSDYVMIFHDDDTLPSNFLFNQISLFKKHNNIGFVVSGINLITSISELDLQSESKLEYILFEKLGEMIKCFYEYPTFGSSSIMFKTNVAKNGIIGYEMYGNVVDRMMLLNCSKEHTFAYMVNPKYNALQHETQDSSNRSWSFEYDINLANLYLTSIKYFNHEEYIFKVIKSISEFYVYSKNKFSILKTIKKISFQNNYYIIYFILLIPYLFLKSKILLFIKKYFLNYFIALNHNNYNRKLSKLKSNIIVQQNSNSIL